MTMMDAAHVASALGSVFIGAAVMLLTPRVPSWWRRLLGGLAFIVAIWCLTAAFSVADFPHP